MGLFNTLMSKIFGAAQPAPSPVTPPTATPTGSQPGTATAGSPAATASASVQSSVRPATPTVDVTAILNAMAAKNSEKLDWKRSIVDLMKLVGMDSSLGARKALATELHYTGDQNDSAQMNIWLHKQVLRKLAENGGKVPAELLD